SVPHKPHALQRSRRCRCNSGALSTARNWYSAATTHVAVSALGAGESGANFADSALVSTMSVGFGIIFTLKLLGWLAPCLSVFPLLRYSVGMLLFLPSLFLPLSAA